LSLYGEAYRPVAPLIGVLATVSLLAALRAVALAALRGVGDRHCALTATAVAAAVNIGLAALLIPHFTVVGAVIANTAAQVTASVWVFVGIWRTHKIGVPMTDFAKLAGAGVLALAVAWAVVGDAHEPLRMIVAGATGVAAFLLACVVLRLIGAREWGLITTSTRRLAARASGATTA
jgi:O-antigen/teichoic acid export membrane protein